MRKFGIAALLFASVFAGSVFADGKALFASNGCTACHNPTKDQLSMGLGPSLKMVAAKYKGDDKGLVEFLQGKGKPRVAPEKYATMQGQIAMVKGKPEAELKDIAKFILSH